MSVEKSDEWTRLNIFKGKSSYGQERIWLDESLRNVLTSQDENLFSYNSVILYQITEGFLSIKRFRQSILNVITKHEIFRTSLEYDADEHYIKQSINKVDDSCYSYQLSYIDVNDKKKLNDLIYEEETSTDHMDLNEGKIFRVHFLKEKNSEDKNRLNQNDYLLLIFHHSGIDQYSKFLFLKELTLAYQTGKLEASEFRFIDYAKYERELDLSKCERFWKDAFFNFVFNDRLKLPYDEKLTIKSSGSFYSFGIDKSLTRQIFRYKQKMNITLFRLFLSTFYCYLFKLTQEKDLCITGYSPNRYRNELNNLIGPLENIIVYRLEVEPNYSFNQVIREVEQLCLDIKSNAHYPYQNLIGYVRKYATSVQYPFTQVALRVDIEDEQWKLDEENNLILNKINLINQEDFKRDTKLTPIDLTLNIKCNLEKQTFFFYFDYAKKLFEEETIKTLAERFQKILKHLFDVNSTFDKDEEQIFKLSIILPNEERLIHNLNVNKDD